MRWSASHTNHLSLWHIYWKVKTSWWLPSIQGSLQSWLPTAASVWLMTFFFFTQSAQCCSLYVNGGLAVVWSCSGPTANNTRRKITGLRLRSNSQKTLHHMSFPEHLQMPLGKEKIWGRVLKEKTTTEMRVSDCFYTKTTRNSGTACLLSSR